MHTGWAAHSGLVAAMLAVSGFQGERTAIEGDRGFLQAYYNSYDEAELTRGLGEQYGIMDDNVKPYACCARIHTVIKALLDIRSEPGIEQQDVAGVQVAMNSRDAETLSHPRQLKVRPPGRLEAQFSIPCTVAAALIYGDVSLQQLTTDSINSAEMQYWMDRIEVVGDPAYDVDTTVWPGRATITTKDGRSFTKEVRYPPGSVQNPMTWDQLVAKFISVGSLSKSVKVLEQFPPLIASIDSEPDMRAFTVLARER